MQTKEKPERPLRWFVLPNESYTWDFMLEKYVEEAAEEEAAAERRGAARTPLSSSTHLTNRFVPHFAAARR